MSEEKQHRPIIIRRKKVVHGHHGGSWKIALADFMTALMALFLVMWILSSSSQEQREGVAEYFRTPLAEAITSGNGQAASSNIIPGGGPDPAHEEGELMRIDLRMETRPSLERQRFRNLKERIEQAIAADPVLRKLRDQLRIEMTPEGLRIQVVDTQQRPMFESGSDRVAPHMRRLLHTLAPLFNEVPNELSISGHTDSVPFVNGHQGYSNWELSADRANASRRELIRAGLDAQKLLRVSGLGDRVPVAESQAGDPVNRRIELLVLDKQVAQHIRFQKPYSVSSRLPSPAGSGAASETTPLQGFQQGLRQALGG
ncbi:flagellar motor protein MotB [Pistricoccus aurantiacus]|uniref:Flagellar motor protein MotB n=1 Tax=Pistricoccus aurantiacus TaxID=1883414 RepID=A0A5B8SXP0_9GAMM|nr:flagellar motor protein MotB [Pistricoccus aurantiacus]QEA40265.1 flagellar motor protein MotB [Pistricoccus aurantiacus]